MRNSEIQELIHSQAGVSKPFIAIKARKSEPEDSASYHGTAFPGMCCQIGEVLESGATFHTTAKAHCCTGTSPVRTWS